MEFIFSVITAGLCVAAEFCYKAMIVVFGIWMAVRWGII